MQPCPDGSYRVNWASRTVASACIGCSGVFPPVLANNDTVPSIPNDRLEHPISEATRGLVRGSTMSCYVRAGEGLVQFESSWRRIAPCPVNTFGVQDVTFGLQPSPCRTCPTGLVTDPLVNNVGWNNTVACYNMAGWGIVQTGVALPCENGTYSPARSMAACRQCGNNRYTLPGAQGAKEDCLVEPGAGIVDGNQSYITSVAASQMTSAQAADLAALDCPPTHYGPGGAVNSVCILCPGGRLASQPGASNTTECNCK
jgi:hypothetical protein